MRNCTTTTTTTTTTLITTTNNTPGAIYVTGIFVCVIEFKQICLRGPCRLIWVYKREQS